MIVAFASNQVMYGKQSNGSGTTETITTDPVPTNGMNQASGIINVHSLLDLGGGGPRLTVTGQISNDGVNWVDMSTPKNVTTTGTTEFATQPAEGQFIRFKFDFLADTGGASTDYTFITFDLHVRLDHS